MLYVPVVRICSLSAAGTLEMSMYERAFAVVAVCETMWILPMV